MFFIIGGRLGAQEGWVEGPFMSPEEAEAHDKEQGPEFRGLYIVQVVKDLDYEDGEG